MQCKDRDSKLITSKEEVLRRWAEHFKSLLNPVENSDGSNAVGERGEYGEEEETGEKEEGKTPPTILETKQAIMKLANNKSPGTDNLPAEIFKIGEENLVQFFHKLIVEIWKQRILPKNLNIGIICTIHKKGNILCKLQGDHVVKYSV